MPNFGKSFVWSIKIKLLLLLLIVFLPASGLIVTTGLDHCARRIEEARSDALVMVESLAAQQGDGDYRPQGSASLPHAQK